MKTSKKLVFFGSGPVGTQTLKGLVKAGFKIEAVITKPKPPHHRGEFPVLDYAKSHRLTVHTRSHLLNSEVSSKHNYQTI